MMTPDELLGVERLVVEGVLHAVSFLFTYGIHSTLLGGVALWMCRRYPAPSPARRSWQLAALLVPPMTAIATVVASMMPDAPLTAPSGMLSSAAVGGHAATPEVSGWPFVLRPMLLEPGSGAYWFGCALVGLWLGIALRRVARTASGARLLRRALKTRAPLCDSSIRGVVERLVEETALGRRLRISHAPSLPSPTVVGWSEICVPSRLVDELTADELRAVLAHEVAHIQHGDWLWFPMLAWVEALMGAQPLNRWLARSFRADAELAADDGAVALTRQPESLARALLRVAERASSTRVETFAATASAGSTGVVARVERLLRRRRSQRRRATRRMWAPLVASLPLLWLGVATGHESPLVATPSWMPPASRDAPDAWGELMERRHTLDVELQTLRWEQGVAEGDARVQELQREIDRLDSLADAMVAR